MDKILRNEHAETAIEQLENLPDGMNELYEGSLVQLLEDGTVPLSTTTSIFQWLLTAHRPLKVQGLHKALQAGSLLREGSLGRHLMSPERMIRKFTFPLVEILADKTVQLVHFSVTEYFVGLAPKITDASETTVPNDRLAVFYYYPKPANITVAITCLLFLQSTRKKRMIPMDQEEEERGLVDAPVGHPLFVIALVVNLLLG